MHGRYTVYCYVTWLVEWVWGPAFQLGITCPGYILEEWVLHVELKDFVLSDRGANKWLKVQKPHVLL